MVRLPPPPEGPCDATGTSTTATLRTLTHISASEGDARLREAPGFRAWASLGPYFSWLHGVICNPFTEFWVLLSVALEPVGQHDLSEEAHGSEWLMHILITLTTGGPRLFPKESAPTDQAVTPHGPCGLTRECGVEGWGLPRSASGQKTARAPTRRAWRPPGQPGCWRPGSHGPSGGEVTGRLGGLSSSDLQASPAPLWSLS